MQTVVATEIVRKLELEQRQVFILRDAVTYYMGENMEDDNLLTRCGELFPYLGEESKRYFSASQTSLLRECVNSKLEDLKAIVDLDPTNNTHAKIRELSVIESKLKKLF